MENVCLEELKFSRVISNAKEHSKMAYQRVTVKLFLLC